VTLFQPDTIVTCVRQANHHWFWSTLVVDHSDLRLRPNCPKALSLTFHEIFPLFLILRAMVLVHVHAYASRVVLTQLPHAVDAPFSRKEPLQELLSHGVNI
jgi:hypothetical protein